MITVLIGGSDLCDYCTDSVRGGGQPGLLIAPDIDREALEVLFENSP